MQRTESFKSKRRVHRLLMLIGVLSVLMMPVDYRGGSSVSHPHATAQLIADLAQGSLDHHGEANTSGGHVHGGEASLPLSPRPSGPLGALSLIPGPLDRGATSHSTATILSLTRLTTSAPADVAAVDEPELSPRFMAGKYVLYSALLPLPVLLLRWWSTNRMQWCQSLAWQGQCPAPEPPPPQGQFGFTSLTGRLVAGR